VQVAACTNSGCTAVPIDVTNGSVYLSLYGTGFSGAAGTFGSCYVLGCQFQADCTDSLAIRLMADLWLKGTLTCVRDVFKLSNVGNFVKFPIKSEEI
jgi:hypothetical protein